MQKLSHQSDADLLDLSNLLRSSEQFDFNRQNKLDDCDIKNNFCAKNVVYFDSNFNADLIKICEDKQIYHNVFFFMNWIWIKMTIINTVILQKNLKSCLLDKTDHWYTEKFSHLIRVNLWNNNKDIEKWCKMLESKFHNLSSWVLSAFEFLHYIINDVCHHKNSVDYIQNVVLHKKNADIAVNNHLQMLLIYKYINDELCLHLLLLTDKFIIENFIEIINVQKNIWFDIYVHIQSTSSNRSQQYQQQ